MRTAVLVTRLSLVAVLVAAGAPAAHSAERYECLVEPFLEVEISSGVPGILDKVPVDRGDVVRSGQVVAQLRSGVERANHDLAQARAEFAARRAERNQELYRKQMISSHERDELETEAELLQLELRQAEERLKLRTIESPLNGVVTKRHYSPGEFVQDEVILELAQLDPLRVEVAVPVRLYGKVRKGMTAEVEWEGPTLGAHEARVMVVDPVIDAASGTIGIRLELPNPDLKLPAGTKCRVTFPVDGAATADAGSDRAGGSPGR